MRDDPGLRWGVLQSSTFGRLGFGNDGIETKKLNERK